MQPKSQYIRLVYASRATFPAGVDHARLNADLARILMQSRRNNPAKGLVGALYFADGCFFQCLEGPAEAVDALYGKLPEDKRHRDLVLLSRVPIDQTSFSNWSMKYVPNASVVRQFLDRHKQANFDPYSFSPAMISEMVTLLLKGPDAAIDAPPEKRLPTTVEEVLVVARRAQMFAALAAFCALIAIVVAVLK